MTKQEISDIVKHEMEKGAVANPSHGITQDNVFEYLVDPVRIKMEMGKAPDEHGWLVFERGEYAMAIDEEEGDVAFLYSYGDGRYGYIASYESLVEAINEI